MATATAPGLPEIERARERLDGVARVTPVYPLRDVLAPRRPVGVSEGREPAAHGLVQDPRRLQQALEPRARATRGRRRRGERRQPRPGGRLGGPRARRARDASSCRRTRRWRRSTRRAATAPRSSSSGAAFEETLAEARRATSRRRGATFVHPYEDTLVIAGQGRSASSSPSRWTSSRRSCSRSAAAGSPSGISPGAARRAARDCGSSASSAAGTRPGGSRLTIADGIAVKEPGELTMAILGRDARRHRRRSRTSRSPRRSSFSPSGRSSWSRARAPSASPRSSVGRRRRHRAGARAPLRRQHRRLAHGAGHAARARAQPAATSSLRTRVPDRPGELAKLLDLLADERVNVVEVEHQREASGIPVGHTGVELTLLTRDRSTASSSSTQMRGVGLPGRAARLSGRFDELPGLIEAKLAEHRARRPRLLRRVRLALPRAPRRPSALRRRRGRALVVVLPVDDDRPLDDDPLRSAARRARPVRVERLRAAAQPARHAAVVLLCRRRPPGTLFDAGFTAHDLFPEQTLYRRLLPVPSHVAMPTGIARSATSNQLLRPATVHSFDDNGGRARPAVRRARRRGARVRDDLSRRRGRADAHGRAGRARGRGTDGGDALGASRRRPGRRARSSCSRPTTGWKGSRPSGRRT